MCAAVVWPRCLPALPHLSCERYHVGKFLMHYILYAVCMLSSCEYEQRMQPSLPTSICIVCAPIYGTARTSQHNQLTHCQQCRDCSLLDSNTPTRGSLPRAHREWLHHPPGSTTLIDSTVLSICTNISCTVPMQWVAAYGVYVRGQGEVRVNVI